MILRRISSALKRQDWATVFIEFVLVIAGVLIALQVNNWNETRGDRELERDILERLHTEITEREIAHTRDALSEERRRHMLYNVRLVLAGQQDPRPFTPEECLAIAQSDTPLLPSVDLPILEEVIATGRLDLIRSTELRRAVSELHRVQAAREVDFETYLADGVNLVRRYPNLLPFRLTPIDNPNDEDGFSPAHPCDAATMMADASFINDFGENVSSYAGGGNMIRRNSVVLKELHDAVDRELDISHTSGDAQ